MKGTLKSNSIDMYFAEISKYKLLTFEEEQRLFREYKKGNIKAREQLINSNLRLVVHVAKYFQDDRIDFLELIQEGNIGLMIAIEKFDVEKGFKFSTYATNWIYQRISRYIEDMARTIRIPVHALNKMNKITNTEIMLTQKLQRKPTYEEIGRELRMSKEIVTELKYLSKYPVALDAPIASNEGDEQSTLSDFVQNNTYEEMIEYIDNTSAHKALEKMLNNIPDSKKELLIKRFGFDGSNPKTLQQLADEYNVTNEAVRLYQKRAIKYMRRTDNIKYILDYNKDYKPCFDEKKQTSKKKKR